MDVAVSRSSIFGQARAPYSKSYAHRRLIASFLAGEEFCREQNSIDAQTTADCLFKLKEYLKDDGAKCGEDISGRERLVLDVKESGSTLRFLLPVVCALGISATFVGGERLAERPIDGLLDCLSKHGACFEKLTSANLPLAVDGKLLADDYQIDATVSSQYTSGLLLALPLLKGDSIVEPLGAPVSAGYVEITRNVLLEYGIKIQKCKNTYRIFGNQRYCSPKEHREEGDWSAASFLLAAGALSGEAKVEGLFDDSQGDFAIVELLKRAGCDVSFERGVATAKKSQLKAVEFDIRDCPDIAPIMAVVLSFAEGTSRINSASRLCDKECDRLNAVLDLLAKTGVRAWREGDSLIIEGKREHIPFCYDPFFDHRMAMSAVVAALNTEGTSVIRHVECVAKSYPSFLEDMRALGAKIEEI